MIAELLILLPLALENGGGNGGKTFSQPLIIPTFDYTTAYIEGAKGYELESIEMKLKGGRL